jgi:hypothetical protein
MGKKCPPGRPRWRRWAVPFQGGAGPTTRPRPRSAQDGRSVRSVRPCSLPRRSRPFQKGWMSSVHRNGWRGPLAERERPFYPLDRLISGDLRVCNPHKSPQMELRSRAGWPPGPHRVDLRTDRERNRTERERNGPTVLGTRQSMRLWRRASSRPTRMARLPWFHTGQPDSDGSKLSSGLTTLAVSAPKSAAVRCEPGGFGRSLPFGRSARFR